jgi:hypothetical protein
MPKLARDRHNILPLFNSLLEQLELHKSAAIYTEELEKKSADTATERRRRTSTEPDIDFPNSGSSRRRDSGSEDVEFPKEETGRRPSIIDLISGSGNGKGNDKSTSSGKGNDKSTSSVNLNEAKEIAKGLAQMYTDPSMYANKQTQDYISNILKTHELSRVNKRQKEVDVAAEDVGRVTELQRLLLTDPIIGEAEPDTVVNLYNTLAKANPEIVKDKNLLRFALREALQYDAVPLHTYKDLISIGKDRADTQAKLQDLEEKRYKI